MTHPFKTTQRNVSPWLIRCLEVALPMHKLGTRICKDRGGLDYLNSLVFELKLNYCQYQIPWISEVINEQTEYIVILMSLENMKSSFS